MRAGGLGGNYIFRLSPTGALPDQRGRTARANGLARRAGGCVNATALRVARRGAACEGAT